MRGIHRSPVNSPHKGQWRSALMFSLISAWINGWVNNLEAGDLRRHHAHYDVIVMDSTVNNGCHVMCPFLFRVGLGTTAGVSATLVATAGLTNAAAPRTTVTEICPVMQPARRHNKWITNLLAKTIDSIMVKLIWFYRTPYQYRKLKKPDLKNSKAWWSSLLVLNDLE